MGFVIGPVPAESNPPINPQYYNPSRFNIAAITNGITTTVTTTINHNYYVGQIVRLTIPSIYLEYQLNEVSGTVITIPAANQVVLNVNSQFFSTFVPNPASGTTQPQIMPVGDINNGMVNTSGRVNTATAIPGSFINVSPA